MESNKYNIENFERFLRDKTDEFRMYPSKRVWYSIYNNMHPGNRLPSVSMSIILIGFLFLVGYLNTENKNTASTKELNPVAATNQLVIADNKQAETNNRLLAAIIPVQTAAPYNGFNSTKTDNTVVYSQVIVPQNHSRRMAHTVQRVRTNVISPVIETAENASRDLSGHSTTNDITLLAENKTSSLTPQNNIDELSSSFSKDLNAVTGNNNTIAVNEDEVTNNTTTAASSLTGKEESIGSTQGNTEIKTDNVVPSVTKSNKSTELSQSNKAWIEDFAMHNKPVAKKWAGKLSLQAYITPSVVYRKLRNNAADKVLSTPSPSLSGTDLESSIINKPSFGVETGVSLQYDIAKGIKIKTGVQFNYTRYNAHAYETNHPVGTSITMNSDDDVLTYESFRTSYYSNAFGLTTAKLHNETYQLSIPIGADIKLASFDRFSWYAGATVQPTIILYGRSYIISTDRRNYIQDPSLLNRFNLNAGFETYISYKTASGYTWQLGPQYRTQIFSTNTKLYSVEEKLRTYGFKIGVMKQL
jgi:hypothetical protein